MSRESIESHKAEFDPEAAVALLKPFLYDIGEKVLAIQSSGNMAVETKKDFADIVTRADTLCEAMLTAHIRAQYPDHRIRGEEGTDVKSESPHEWIIDPIDGTTNFANGMELFSISAGLYESGEGQMGVMYFPALKKFVYAIKGKGAWVNEKRAAFQPTKKKLQDSLISVGLKRGTEKLFEPLRARSRNVLAGGSFTAESLWLIEGKIDACVYSGATPYDCAAARIIVEEAGGVASGFKDGTINLNDEEIPIILAKSPDLVRELQEIVKG